MVFGERFLGKSISVAAFPVCGESQCEKKTGKTQLFRQ
jgi:hypothetical protein